MKARVAIVIAVLALAIGGAAWWAASDDDAPAETVATETESDDAALQATADDEHGEPDHDDTKVPTEPGSLAGSPGEPYVFPWGDGFLELVLTHRNDTPVQAAVSENGIEWTSVDVDFPDLPDGNVSATAVIGERLVMSYGPWGQSGSPPDPILLETEDLVTWRQIDLPIDDPVTELPDFVARQTQVDRIAATDAGWVAVQSTFTFLEPERLLPISQADFEQGYGIGITPEGIEFDPEDGESRLFTWEELGVDPELGAALPQHEQQVTLWHAPWGGDPQPVDLEGAHWVSALASDGTDYLMSVHRGTSSELLRSSDGISWNPAPAPVGDINALAPIEGGWVAQVWRMSGVAITVSDDDGASWRTVETNGLPDTDQISLFSQTSAASSGLASVAFVHEVPPSILDGTTITYRHDGFDISVQDGQSGSSVTIVDTATGEVVLDETYTPPTNDEIRALEEAGDTEALDALREMGPAWRAHGDTTSDFVDPATGEIIVSVPWEVEAEAWDAAFSEADDRFEDPGPPEMWLLATQDGTDWLSVLLTDEERPFLGLGVAAINGDTVVVSTGTERTVYTVGR